MSFRRIGPERYPTSVRSDRRRDDRQLGAGRVVSEQAVEQHEPVAQEPRRQEVAPNVLLPAQRTLPSLRGIAQDLDAGLGTLGGRIDEPPRLAVLDLGDDAPDGAGDRRTRLP